MINGISYFTTFRTRGLNHKKTEIYSVNSHFGAVPNALARDMLKTSLSKRFDKNNQNRIHPMKITTHLTAAFFATAFFTSSAFAGALWPSQPEHSAPQQTVSKQTTAKVTSRRTKHYAATIATYTSQPAPKPAAVEIPSFHNIANGSF